MREFSEKLSKYGITLASNQFEYSLVNRDAEADGTLAECKRLGERDNNRKLSSRDGRDSLAYDVETFNRTWTSTDPLVGPIGRCGDGVDRSIVSPLTIA